MNPPALSRPGRPLAVGALLLGLLAVPTTALADEDPGLGQTIDPDQATIHGTEVLDSGHVDLGPKYVDGGWRLLVHDDAARSDAGATSVWRLPEETVLHVRDEGRLTVPDDPAYAFLGAEPGAGVWVVPQTQDPDVVWLGWNTQDPEVMATVDRGVTLTLAGVQGPGTVTVYLQSGSFGEPELLWDSRAEEPRPVWVDVNTHTHANWVFTEPGVYLLALTAEAELIDGTTATDTAVVRVAVGTDTDPADALAAVWAGAAPGGSAEVPDAGPGSGAADDDRAGVGAEPGPDAGAGPRDRTPVLVAGLGAVAALLAVALAVTTVRARRAERRVLDRRDRPVWPAAAVAERPAGDGTPGPTGEGATGATGGGGTGR